MLRWGVVVLVAACNVQAIYLRRHRPAARTLLLQMSHFHHAQPHTHDRRRPHPSDLDPFDDDGFVDAEFPDSGRRSRLGRHHVPTPRRWPRLPQQPHFLMANTHELYHAMVTGTVTDVHVVLALDGTDPSQGLFDDDSTPLHFAAERGDFELVNLLVIYGADVHATDSDGHTPLHLAVKAGERRTVQLLLDAGARVADAIDNMGSTPLHVAVGVHGPYSQPVLMQLLQNGGMSALGIRDNRGETPHDIAMEHNHGAASMLADAQRWHQWGGGGGGHHHHHHHNHHHP
jgi:hypothetical protein